MRTTLTLIALATSLSLNFGAYAADTSVPGATNSTPGAESKGNPITPPDNGTAAASQTRRNACWRNHQYPRRREQKQSDSAAPITPLSLAHKRIGAFPRLPQSTASANATAPIVSAAMTKVASIQ